MPQIAANKQPLLSFCLRGTTAYVQEFIFFIQKIAATRITPHRRIGISFSPNSASQLLVVVSARGTTNQKIESSSTVQFQVSIAEAESRAPVSRSAACGRNLYSVERANRVAGCVSNAPGCIANCVSDGGGGITHHATHGRCRRISHAANCVADATEQTSAAARR